MRFPHLSDTSFPDIDTVNPYQFKNEFDYTRWNELTRIRLVNVLWNSDYSDVVDFDSDRNRDEWFDSLQDAYEIELTQSARIVPDNYIKLPIPYDVMARYNYLYVDIPIATSEDVPIDYENGNGKRRWYFFVSAIAYLAPSTTQVYLTLDVWCNYHNDIEITYMLLERGHAPVAYSDVDEYLRNPISNNEYLLAPDVNFGDASITRDSDFIPFGNGTKYVCMASTCSPDKLSTLGTVTNDGEYSPHGTITYSDTQDRYGHQIVVHGLTVGNGKDFSNARVPAATSYSDGDIANNLTVYAVPASECYVGTFYSDVAEKCPQFLKTIMACFVVDEGCIKLGTSYKLADHTIRKCVGSRRNLLSKQLTVEDFDYPSELRRYAKLYTSPYAVLEVTDNDGTTYDIRIEETSTVTVKSVVSVAFPYIDMRVYLDGVGGVGSKSYVWRDLNGNMYDMEMPNSDWFKYCFDWEIPTFALYMDGETAYQLESFNRNTRMGINNALVAYHNNMRSANTAKENAEDSADTALGNVNRSTTTAKDNLYASADTGEQNAYNSANAAKENAYNSANTAKTNTYNNADTSKTNADASADTMYTNVDNNCTTLRTNTTLAIANTVSNEEQGITASNLVTDEANQLAYNTVAESNLEMGLTTLTTNEVTSSTTTNNNQSAIETGEVGGIMGGAALGAGVAAGVGTAVVPGVGTAIGALVGALGGAIIGGVGGHISANYAQSNASVVMQANQVTTDATIAMNVANVGYNANAALNTNTLKNTLRRFVYQNNNTLASTEIDNNNANDRTNANNSRVTEKANATRNQTTAKTNANNTETTAKVNADNIEDATKTNATNTMSVTKGNADRTFTTDRANANDTRNTAVANAGYTREVSELNAKELLENAANAAQAPIYDARNREPVRLCDASGTPAADYMRTRGVQLKVKTQSDSAIRQTGAAFARFGYALNQIWNVQETGFKLMRNFTFWKCADVWVNDNQNSNDNVQDTMTKILMRGVTVWEDPMKIGKVSLYDN